MLKSNDNIGSKGWKIGCDFFQGLEKRHVLFSKPWKTGAVFAFGDGWSKMTVHNQEFRIAANPGVRGKAVEF